MRVDKLLLSILLLASMRASASLCYQSDPNAKVDGFPGGATLTLLWSPDGSAMDGLRVESSGRAIEADMNCTDVAPISCQLGDEGGKLRLVFDGDGVQVVSAGLGLRSDGVLSAKPGRKNQSLRLHSLPKAKCETIFPVSREIHVFNSDPADSVLR